MARPLRLELAGALYHITSRGDGRDDIFLSDDDRVAGSKRLPKSAGALTGSVTLIASKRSLEGATRIPGNILTWPTIAKPCCWQNFFLFFTVNLRDRRKTRGVDRVVTLR